MKISIKKNTSPKDFDIAFTSISQHGTLRELNKYVLNELGYSQYDLPNEKELQLGHAILRHESKKTIIFIVTVSNRSTKDNLKDNLFEALNQYKDILYDRKVWIPLMGTGSGRLSFYDSFTFIYESINRLKKTYDLKINLTISCPNNISIKEIRSMKLEVLLHDSTNFYLVGSTWAGNQDQTLRFIEGGFWENGYDDKYIDLVNSIKSGDVLVLKSTFVNRQKPIFRLKAIGEVIENLGDQKLIVNWKTKGNIDIEGQFARYRKTIHKITITIFQDIEEYFDKKSNIEKIELDKEGIIDVNIDDGIQEEEEIEEHAIKSTIINNDLIEDDQLDFDKDVKSLAALIASVEVKPPLAIALFGDWGSGKSFFMRNIEKRIRQLSTYQGFISFNSQKSIKNEDSISFVKGVAHIHFNAWSYLDSNLWAGFAHSLFQKLDEYITNNTSSEIEKLKIQLKISSRLEILHSDILHYEEKIKHLKNLELKLTDDKKSKLTQLTTSKYDKSITSFLDALGIEKENIPFILPSELKKDYLNIRRFWLYISSNRVKLILVFLLLLSLCIVLHKIGVFHKIGTSISLIFSFILPFSPFFYKLLKFKKAFKDFYKDKDENSIETEIKTIKESLNKINNLNETIQEQIKKEKEKSTHITEIAISNFISSRIESEDYKKHLGIITTIRKDFETLSELFSDYNRKEGLELNEKEQKFQENIIQDRQEIDNLFSKNKPSDSNIHKLGRIILYIDDLDRCSDEKVIEVLEAVHLLMAFPLFIVVVGVDERSVYNALQNRSMQRYKGIDIQFQKDFNIKKIEPREYLEKIFQIPFQLPKPTNDGVERLISSLIQVELSKNDATQQKNESSNTAYSYTINPLTESRNITISKEPNPDYFIENTKDITTEKPVQISISELEKEYLTKFSVLIGNNPRSLKRYVNIYKIAKAHDKIEVAIDVEQIRLIFILAIFFSENEELIQNIFYLNSNQTLLELISSSSTISTLLNNQFENITNDLKIKNALNVQSVLIMDKIKFINRFTFTIK